MECHHRLRALLDGPDPWPEALADVPAEPITSAQRERLLRAFDRLNRHQEMTMTPHGMPSTGVDQSADVQHYATTADERRTICDALKAHAEMLRRAARIVAPDPVAMGKCEREAAQAMALLVLFED